ncbi:MULTISPECIES: universal stress protein [Actinomadura]|uniref:UspA domain-containing protein n=1 Tax=Actinomadura litoris TaxID=2678616 RepID=A0A7K1L2E3_9ACTN|nr:MULTISPECIES: universal stress protein [Actinomadura]MBT2209000.1 universal stress protein [Actinomadura sp. NEAU-AAG7]MUN38435.1 hypothetical protein [Actinomadura litoris]
MPDHERGRPPAVPAWAGGRTGGHLIAVTDGRREMAAHQAARLAAATGGPVTVALLSRPPWTAAFDPSALECWRNGDLEIAALTRLSEILDPAGARWRMVTVDGDPVRGILALARRHPPSWVLVPRSRRPFSGRRLASVLRSRHGLPLLLV